MPAQTTELKRQLRSGSSGFHEMFVKQRNAMTYSPKDSGKSGAADSTLLTYDRRNSNDVIGISRVAHSKEETESENRKHGHDNFSLDINYAFIPCSGVGPPCVCRAVSNSRLIDSTSRGVTYWAMSCSKITSKAQRSATRIFFSSLGSFIR